MTHVNGVVTKRQRRYTLSGPVVSGQTDVSMTIYQNTGGNFNAPPIRTAHPVDGVHYIAAVGRSVFGGAVPRWRHYATLHWSYGPWGATLAQVYSSGYTEINPSLPNNERNVGAYDIWNLQVTYSGIANTMLTLGIKDLFDRAPPFSNQSAQALVMFDPRYADPRGRLLYAQLAVSFK